jgi:hypothetical protein
MGFGDKLKGLRDQAQQAVVENKDKIQGAVQSAAEVANARTGGKYADKISNVGEKLNANLEKIADETAAPAGGVSDEPATVVADEPAATVTDAPVVPVADQPVVPMADEPVAPVFQDKPTVAPSGTPPEFE